jgi:intracellular multiplication protein IcmV
MGIISGLSNMVTNALGYDSIKKSAQGIKSMAGELTTAQKAQRKETFEEALVRLNLTEEDIEKRRQEFQKLFRIFSIFGVGLLCYLVYAIFSKAIIASLGTVGILLFVIAQLFRYDFWLFQIREKRLGCTFKEWFNDLVGKKP